MRNADQRGHLGGQADQTGPNVQLPETPVVAEHESDSYGTDRAGSTEGEAATAGQASAESGRAAGAQAGAVDAVRGAGGAVSHKARLTALGVAVDIQRAGSAALVGRTVNSPEELASLAQDNLEGFWKGQFGHTHGITVVTRFYEPHP